jgi:hypothetical protein
MSEDSPRASAALSPWRNPEDRRWLLATVAVKLIFAVAVTLLASRLPGAQGYHFYTEMSGDTASYLGPAENLLSRGRYTDSSGSRAGRMPGYTLTYLPFRALLPVEAAKTAIAGFQVLLSGLSVYYLALTGFLLFQRTTVFFVVLVLYGLNLFVSVFDVALQTESLAATAAIFFFYSLTRFRTRPLRRYLVVAGFWYAYLVFLRPFGAPFLISGLFLVWPATGSWKEAALVTARRLAWIAVVFVAADGLWIARNLVTMQTFIPLQVNSMAGYAYTPSQLALRRWLQAIGHETHYWKPNTMASWFYQDPKFTNEQYAIPPYVLTSRCSMDDIRVSREAFHRAAVATDLATRTAADATAARKLDACSASLQAEKPLRYYLLSPLGLIGRLVVHAGPVLPLPVFQIVRHRPLLLGLKLLGVSLYWLTIIAGTAGLLWSMTSRRPELWAIAFPTIFVVLFFAFGVRHSESRFLTISFPFLSLAGAVTIDRIVELLRGARISSPGHAASRLPPDTAPSSTATSMMGGSAHRE